MLFRLVTSHPRVVLIVMSLIPAGLDGCTEWRRKAENGGKHTVADDHMIRSHDP